jgi:hypothetical protein
VRQNTDEKLGDIAESQTLMRDAIEQTGRLIEDNERLISEHRKQWPRARPERSD